MLCPSRADCRTGGDDPKHGKSGSGVVRIGAFFPIFQTDRECLSEIDRTQELATASSTITFFSPAAFAKSSSVT
jgi:hypothetical protein